jgi:hypothetical protein
LAELVATLDDPRYQLICPNEPLHKGFFALKLGAMEQAAAIQCGFHSLSAGARDAWGRECVGFRLT